MKQLSSENKVIWILGKIGQFILLNFLVLLGCIPIVTIGASVTAGMYCMSKMHDPESMIITVEYFHAFMSNFKKSTIVWLVLYHNRRGSASVDVLAGAKRSSGVRSSGGKSHWYSGTGM